MIGSNASHTICECNHMTDFAVLADTSKAKVSSTVFTAVFQ